MANVIDSNLIFVLQAGEPLRRRDVNEQATANDGRHGLHPMFAPSGIGKCLTRRYPAIYVVLSLHVNKRVHVRSNVQCADDRIGGKLEWGSCAGAFRRVSEDVSETCE